MKTTRVFLLMVLAFAAIGLPAYAALPCCTVTGVSAKTGMVTAKETSTGRTFKFKADPATLKTLSVGSPIYANFSTKQVSTNGLVPCCAIVSLSAAVPVAASGKSAPASANVAAPASSVENSSTPMLSATSHAMGTGFNVTPGAVFAIALEARTRPIARR